MLRMIEPRPATPAAGDLLCFVRGNGQPFGHAGLQRFLAAGNGSLAMHCDIAIGTSRDGAYLYLVGGNVLQGVTLRQLALNRRGALWSLPRGSTESSAYQAYCRLPTRPAGRSSGCISESHQRARGSRPARGDVLAMRCVQPVKVRLRSA